MSIADIQARSLSKMGRTAPGARSAYFAAADKARRTADLKADGYVVPFSQWLGHNNGPDMFESGLYLEYCWRRAHEEAWKPPSQEIGVRRARKAAELGVSYRDYVLEILEHGRYLDAESVAKERLEVPLARTLSLRAASLGTSPVRTGEDVPILPCEAGEVASRASGSSEGEA